MKALKLFSKQNIAALVFLTLGLPTVQAQDAETSDSKYKGVDWNSRGERPKKVIKARLRQEVRGEFASDENGDLSRQHDFDSLTWLMISTRGIGADNIETRFAGRYEWDIDGTTRFSNEFADRRDIRYARNGYARISEGYVKANDLLGGKVAVTAGRQYFNTSYWPVRYDGLRVDVTDIGAIDLSFFGGASVRFGSSRDGSSIPVSEVFGVQIPVRVSPWLTLTISDVQYQENLLDISVVGSLPGLDFVHFSNAFTFVNGEPFDATLNTDIEFEQTGTLIRTTMVRKFSGGNKLFYDFSFTDRDRNRFIARRKNRVRRLFLNRLARSTDVSLSLEQPFTRRFQIFTSLRRHEVSARRSNGFETSYTEVAFGFSVIGLIRGLTFDLQAIVRESRRPRANRSNDFYSTSDDGESEYKELVFNARYRLKKILLEFNTFVKLYDYQNRFIRYSDLETYGFEGRLVAKLTRNIKVFANYYFEDDLEINAPHINSAQAIWAGFEISWGYPGFDRQQGGK